MKADPDDILGHESQRSRFPLVELLLALAMIAGLVFFWFWSGEKETVAQLPTVIIPTAPSELLPTPDIPEREELVTVVVPGAEAEATAQPAAPAIRPPLTPEEGKMLLRKELAAAGADANLLKVANTENPVDLSAALIDGLGRGIILRKMLPLDPPKQAFSVEQNGDTLYMSSASFERYNGYTDAVTALDTDVLVEAFHVLRPLYKAAYEQLGLDPEDLDNAIIRTLDLVLATPEINEPIALNTKSVVYVYQDPALEALSAVQKQLLRTGPDNLRRIKEQARVLREGLLTQ